MSALSTMAFCAGWLQMMSRVHTYLGYFGLRIFFSPLSLFILQCEEDVSSIFIYVETSLCVEALEYHSGAPVNKLLFSAKRKKKPVLTNLAAKILLYHFD